MDPRVTLESCAEAAAGDRAALQAGGVLMGFRAVEARVENRREQVGNVLWHQTWEPGLHSGDKGEPSEGSEL